MLESLIRLAEAHARLRFSREIEIFDAINVIILMEHCINTGLFDKNYSCLISPETYSQAKRETLLKLGFNDSSFFAKDEFDMYEYSDSNQNDIRPKNERRNPVNMGGEDTMMMLGMDQTDYLTNTYVMGIEKATEQIGATDIPDHCSNGEDEVINLDS